MKIRIRSPHPHTLQRKRLRRMRQKRALLALLLPTLCIVAMDVVLRAKHLLTFDRMHALGYVGSIFESIFFWGSFLYVAAKRRGWIARVFSVVFFISYAVVVSTQLGFFSVYNIYLSIDGQIHSKSIPLSIVGHWPFLKWAHWLWVILAGIFGWICLWITKRNLRVHTGDHKISLLLVVVFIVSVVKIPVSFRSIQSTTPDMIYFNGLVGLVKEELGLTNDSPELRVQARHVEKVPKIYSNNPIQRNVLLILQESQRSDVTCVQYDPECDLATPFSNKAAPDRMPLNQVRANDSTTAISISTIWSGVVPTEGRELLHSVPLLWDYALAAGWDTAYWTSQNLMFGNARLYVQDIPVSHRCVGTELDPYADLDTGAHDRLLTDKVLQEWTELKEPFYAVVHYSNNHYPYVYDENNAPFQPAEFTKAADKNDEFKNYYKNVVYLSDKAVGRLIEGIRKTDSGQKTVIVYTADHGESFREHWQLGHTSSVYDEEILVPTWIDAPEGTLTEQERSNIERKRDAFLWHIDMAPTFLDLMGLGDAPELSRFRARMMGHSILRPELTVEPVPLTNCTWVWECAFRNWGMMLGPMKLEAREWDGEYHCFNVLDDPMELTNLGEEACAPLPSLARQIYGAMPNATPPGKAKVNWGK